MSDERPWTAQEDAQLRAFIQSGATRDFIVSQLTIRLNRSSTDVRIRGFKLQKILESESARAHGLPPPRSRIGELHPDTQAKRASAHGVTMLYRYRPLRNETDLDRAVGEGLLGRFYFPTRAQLRANDNSDLLLKFVMQDLEKARTVIRDQMQLRGMTPQQIAKAMARFDSDSAMWKRLHEMNTVYAAELDASFGTICFTYGGNTDAKFWDNYTADHGGVCLHLDARTQPLSDALLVEYSDQKHEIEITDQTLVPFMDLMLHKRPSYSWEKEYRILYLPGMWEPITVDKDRYATIHPHCVVGITFGANIRPEYRTEFLMHLQLQAEFLFDESNLGTALRSELPPLYQASPDDSDPTRVIAKKFEFDFINRVQIFS